MERLDSGEVTPSTMSDEIDANPKSTLFKPRINWWISAAILVRVCYFCYDIYDKPDAQG